MLEWYHEKGKWFGFDDDCPLYKVDRDGNGWYYEYLPEGDGMDGYDTAEEAKAAAESEFASKQIETNWDDLEPLSLEDLEEIHWDDVAHERMERAKGFID